MSAAFMEKQEDAGIIEHPLQKIVRIVFNKEMTPWELAERVHRMKKEIRVEVDIPLDHPALASLTATAYLGRMLGSKDGVTAVCGDKNVRLQLKRAGALVRGGGPVGMPGQTRGAHRGTAWVSEATSMMKRKKTSSRTIQVTAAGGVLLVVLLFLFTNVLPRAQVTIILDPRVIEKTERATVQSRTDAQDKNPRRLRGSMAIREERVTLTIPIIELSEGGIRATGQLQFENQTGNGFTVTAGAPLISDDGISYQTEMDVFVPPAIITDNNTVLVGTVRVRAKATDPGVRGNRMAGRMTITSVPEPRRSRIFASISEPFTGGTNRQGTIVTDKHIADALPRATEEMGVRSADALRLEHEGTWWHVAELMQATSTHIDAAPPVGSEADTMTLTVDGRVSSLLISRDDTLRLFGIRTEDCAAGVCTLSGASIRTFDPGAGTADADFLLVRRVLPTIDRDALVAAMAGQSIQDARHTVLSTVGVQDVRITLRMSIRKYLSKNTERITITIE